MQDADSVTQPTKQAITRRGFLSGTLSLGLTTALGSGLFGVGLAGCANNRHSTRLPDPPWPETAALRKPPIADGPPPTIRPAQPVVGTAGFGGIIRARREWTLRGVDKPTQINPMNGVRRITVHHDGMQPVQLATPSQIARRIELIRNSHVNGRNWADIGYHYVIDPRGEVWEARPLRFQGAHVADQNEHNIGVLVLGNFDKQHVTREATQTLDGFVASLMRKHGVPISRVKTHQELATTGCPGVSLQRYMISTRARGGGLARAVTA